MFPLFIPLILKLFVSATAIALVVSFWDAIRESVASWLRNNGHENSWLMEAIIQFDRVVGKARNIFKATIRVRGKRSRVFNVVDEYEKNVDEIDDEDVKNQLMKSRKNQESFNILEMVTTS